MMRRATLFAALIFFCAITTARADDPVSLAAYQRVVEQTIVLVKQSQGALLDERPGLLKQAAALLGTVRLVRLDSGDTITVNNADLIAEMHRTAEDSQHLYIATALNARLAALRAALADPPTSASDANLQALRDIYDRPPFKRNDTENFLRELNRRFNRWLREFFNRTDDVVFDARDFISLGGVLVTILVVALFIIRLRQNLAAEAELESDENAETVTSSRAALAQAQRFAGAGDYRSAVRMLYLATLLLLDERGKLRYDKSLTNREYLRAVKNEPPVADALQPIVETFDRTWYGFEDVTPEQFDEYERRVEEIKKL